MSIVCGVFTVKHKAISITMRMSSQIHVGPCSLLSFMFSNFKVSHTNLDVHYKTKPWDILLVWNSPYLMSFEIIHFFTRRITHF